MSIPSNPAAQQLIDGKLVASSSGQTFAILNPATGREIGRAPDGTAQDVDAAIAAARRAFDTTDWSTDHDFRIAGAEGALQVLQLHPMLNPAAYVYSERCGDSLSIRASPAHEDGGWLDLLGPRSLRPLQAVAQAVDPLLTVEIRGDDDNWTVSAVENASRAVEFDEVTITRFSSGVGFAFERPRSLPITPLL